MGWISVSRKIFGSCCCNVFHSYMQKHIKQLKDVEKFALRIATKSWDSGYQDLLSQKSSGQSVHVQKCSWFMVLSTQHDYHKAKPQSPYKQATILLQQPFAGTNAYLYHILFVRGTCSLNPVLTYLCSILRVLTTLLKVACSSGF